MMFLRFSTRDSFNSGKEKIWVFGAERDGAEEPSTTLDANPPLTAGALMKHLESGVPFDVPADGGQMKLSNGT